MKARRDQAIMACISRAPMTIVEIVSKTKIPENRVRYALMTWHKRRDIRISEWVRVLCYDGKYRVAPKFTAVKGYDAPPPEGVNRKGMKLEFQPPETQIISSAIRSWFDAPVQ